MKQASYLQEQMALPNKKQIQDQQQNHHPFDQTYSLFQEQLHQLFPTLCQSVQYLCPEQNLQQGLLTLINDTNSFQNFSESQPQKFKELINHIKQGDFSCLMCLWNENWVKKLQFILQNWKQFSLAYHQSFKEFITYFNKKINTRAVEKEQQKQEFYDQFYPKAIKTIKKMIKKTQYSEQRKQSDGIQKDQHQRKMLQNNNMFLHVLREQQMRAIKGGVTYVKVKKNMMINGQEKVIEEQVAIGEYIAEREIYSQNKKAWAQILFIAKVCSRFNKDIIKDKQKVKAVDKVHEFSELLLNNHELAPSSNRICCAKFFYIGFDINPLLIENVFVKNELFQLKGKAPNEKNQKRKKNQQEQIFKTNFKNSEQVQDVMMDICALLNSGGGIILFNCKKQYLQIWATGQQIIQQKKKIYKIIIEKLLSKIHPKVSRQQVRISFVPVAKNPYDHGYPKEAFQEDERENNRNYITGLYVMRIAVFPKQTQKMYFFQQKAAIVRDQKKYILKGEQVVQEMKKRYQFFETEGDEEDDLQMQLLAKDNFYEEPHQCQPPYRGSPIQVEPVPRKPKNCSSFGHLNLLIAPEKYFDRILRQLKNKGIECQFDNHYRENHKQFQLTKNSIPIYHNIRFDELLAQMAYKKQFKYDSRPALLVNVTKCIKLTERIGNRFCLPLQEYNNLQRLFCGDPRFKGQRFEYWLFDIDTEDRNKQHYLRTSSSQSLIYLYYLLAHVKQRGLLKNPPTPRNIEGANGNMTVNQQNKFYKKNVNQRMKLMYVEQQQKFFIDDDQRNQ